MQQRVTRSFFYQFAPYRRYHWGELNIGQYSI
jgi:hypothetical protein